MEGQLLTTREHTRSIRQMARPVIQEIVAMPRGSELPYSWIEEKIGVKYNDRQWGLATKAICDGCLERGYRLENVRKFGYRIMLESEQVRNGATLDMKRADSYVHRALKTVASINPASLNEEDSALQRSLTMSLSPMLGQCSAAHSKALGTIADQQRLPHVK